MFQMFELQDGQNVTITGKFHAFNAQNRNRLLRIEKVYVLRFHGHCSDLGMRLDLWRLILQISTSESPASGALSGGSKPPSHETEGMEPWAIDMSKVR